MSRSFARDWKIRVAGELQGRSVGLSVSVLASLGQSPEGMSLLTIVMIVVSSLVL
ncbi:hypothetical protein RL72_00262 [Microbacterium azadirachtae]|uniref:Uncharacterized protein n=1 Tax=Microbacterium azadirachtae TaxID=582680 RepID=A0A0F0LF01_9MICO|nr:hypothetical protein RL72_00262 [Microbacterium azadirachtae]